MSTTEQPTLQVAEGRLHDREQALRLALARLLDAQERYPNDLATAKAIAVGELRRQPLWSELADEENQRVD